MSNIKEFLKVTAVENKIDGLDTKLSNKLDTTSQELKASMGNLDTSVGNKLDSQKADIDTALAAQKATIDTVGSQIVIGTPVKLTHKVEITSSRTWTSPIDGTVYVTVCGGGGGGAGGLFWSSAIQAGGQGGAGANTAFRVPLQVSKGDVLRVTIGSGGAGGAYIKSSSVTSQKSGGPGGATKVENITALASKPALELSYVTQSVEALGGPEGHKPGSTGKLSINEPAEPISFNVSLQRVGWLVRGGEGGDSYIKRSNTVTETVQPGKGAGNTFTHAWDGYPKRGARHLGGGAGGSAFSLIGFGTGGQGGSPTQAANLKGSDGEPGVAYIEYN